MKIATLFFLFTMAASAQQDSTPTIIIQPMGYYPSGRLDTIKTLMLVSATPRDDSDAEIYMENALVIFGREVLERYTYNGDRMPPGDYSDQLRHRAYLYLDGAPLKPGLTVWMSQEYHKP